jgi:SSS family solute:Na+ symporter
MIASFVCAIGDVSILTKALFFTSLFTGPLLGIFLQAFFMPWTHPKAVIAGTFCGMAALLPFSNIPILPPGTWTPMYSLAWPWNPLITVTASIISAQLISVILGGRGRTSHPPRVV